VISAFGCPVNPQLFAQPELWPPVGAFDDGGEDSTVRTHARLFVQYITETMRSLLCEAHLGPTRPRQASFPRSIPADE